MTADAQFEDGQEDPLRLKAEDAADLKVLSALLQDAVFPGTEMRWEQKKRRFGLLINRFRWEDRDKAAAQSRGVERVQSVLVVDGVLGVASSGVVRAATDTVFSILALDFAPAKDGAGALNLVLAGDGIIRLDVECIDVSLRDVTRPYLAPSGHAPTHKE